MDNLHPEAITVQLGGGVHLNPETGEETPQPVTTHHLKFGPAAFRYAAKRHKVEFPLDRLQNPDVAMFATLLWIGMLPSNPLITEDEVLAMLSATPNEMAIIRPVLEGVKRMADGITEVAETDDEETAAAKKD